MAFFRDIFNRGENHGLRIIITRHGERVDFELGSDWFQKMQQSRMRDPRISYMAFRPDPNEWQFDTPLTVKGEHQAKYVGKDLQRKGFNIDYCYASPAYRCVQTARNVLEGQNRPDLPINVETGKK
jgi:ubiquitin-associated and SH3 domain-containing protein